MFVTEHINKCYKTIVKNMLYDQWVHIFAFANKLKVACSQVKLQQQQLCRKIPCYLFLISLTDKIRASGSLLLSRKTATTAFQNNQNSYACSHNSIWPGLALVHPDTIWTPSASGSEVLWLSCTKQRSCTQAVQTPAKPSHSHDYFTVRNPNPILSRLLD